MNRYIALAYTMMLLVATVTAAACKAPPPVTVEYSLPELKYIALASFDDVFWCDPDLYPVAREGQEPKNALEQFPAISANATEFSAILNHLSLPNQAEYTDEEKLLIYREHKKLTYQIEMTSSGNVYQFTLRVKEGQGERIIGTVTPSGIIKVTKRETSFNTCPICLAQGTLIATPAGQVAVEQLHEGMAVWTTDNAGNRVIGTVVKTTMTPVAARSRW